MSHNRDMTVLGGEVGNDQTYIEQAEHKSDLLKWQQDLADELENLKHKLRSEHKVGDKWVPKTHKVKTGVNYSDGRPIYREENLPPLCNELFIDHVETQVEPFLSRNLINSNFNEKRILSMLRTTMDDIADVMADGWDTYDIKFQNYDIIVRLIKNIIIPGTFRALNGWTKRTDSTMIKRIEQMNEMAGQEAMSKKKAFGLFG